MALETLETEGASSEKGLEESVGSYCPSIANVRDSIKVYPGERHGQEARCGDILPIRVLPQVQRHK